MHRIGLILPYDFQLLNLAALTAFELTAESSGSPRYDLHLLSEQGGPLRSSSGLIVETEALGHPAFDTIVVGAITSFAMPAPSTANMIAFVRAAATASRRVASFCNGAYVLAEAGLLHGRRATTHWSQVASFKARFPNVKLEENKIFINDGPIWTSAGMTAAVDLALAMIDRDLGPRAANLVARLLVVDRIRMGGQNQHSAMLDMTPKSDRIQSALAYVRQNLKSTLSVEELAGVAGLSPRQFSRAFLTETGQPPAKAVELLRLEAARFMMEEGRHPVNVVAQEAGFLDRERMRRAFLRMYGLSPQAMRKKAKGATVD
ncbi:GlxA family transcriptional regulator [Bradyrhizobium sp. WYCCWR 13023]|uniref:GlxA family transcriptional regulator n=1 Tax=Bradyrhizobium zhengyangense TaxID=2911009 RepID=A0A9X1R9R4_9BRAD|nr:MULTISPECIES: GlxA family transcriptional regulator [Bradyrhizobium]MCG2626290.1 GlxA family transcriptional regulator [Bradyrhizobium zhengyangense]MCG2644698.1 GlxA family transcriptional regulator [Bradyrhizobium zhengyangense]MCG2668298.1 GlxA family transcriptional regulator [Bradyrhizobium zhengyangense]MDA9521248.1 AraC family transcriptional regulator [Bradyrhizobium sp. CCBAU 11434]